MDADKIKKLVADLQEKGFTREEAIDIAKSSEKKEIIPMNQYAVLWHMLDAIDITSPAGIDCCIQCSGCCVKVNHPVMIMEPRNVSKK